MINTGQLNGTEVMLAVKRKINHESPIVQGLALDMLETFAVYCNMVFSKVVSEMVLEDMTWFIYNPHADKHNQKKALQLIESWANLGYPDYLGLLRESQSSMVIDQKKESYMGQIQRKIHKLGGGGAVWAGVGGGVVWVFGGSNLKNVLSLIGRDEQAVTAARKSAPAALYLDSTLSRYTHKDPLDPPEGNTIPEEAELEDSTAAYSPPKYLPMSNEEKKVHLVAAQDRFELFSSIVYSEGEPTPLKEDLTLSLLDDCKLSLAAMKRILERTTNDEVTNIEALYLNDELEQLVSQFDDLEVAQMYGAQQPQNADSANLNELPERFEGDDDYLTETATKGKHS
ncbi:TOM1-like protein 2 [Lotus japonicus]|uniref:TOM1-like protein 2 n=1 Tax=Lotus japonicus TaxID=34305 RepID=UPI00258B865C|nr:TOM1-like protein 2 [Lotus japonicus]